MSSDSTIGACLALDRSDEQTIATSRDSEAGKFHAFVQKKTDAYHQELRWLTKLEEVR